MQGGSGGGAAPPQPQDAILIQLFHITVFPDTQVIPKWLVLQYFQIHKLYQNGWSFSISRKAGDIRMLGPSVFPEKQVIPKCLVLQHFQIHGLKKQVLKPQMDFLGLISSPKRLLN